ncbi:hypothetical protein [Catellatospora tritici]|uniref:hypothetical protein n=1 Tax=Catellatospora tritici TaxID=2851566 RepID=UPI001C2DD62C|nr:hypothetical protein [Catellatospora tritici]MBV1849529.1 hypothetical protein [Catellatospora tritici]MBV1854101.1 hypothetical protein [Catellatospora tritici]
MAHPRETVVRMPIKIVISLALFSITFLATLAFEALKANEPLVLSFGVSLFVAGLAFVVQFLYDVERRLGRVEDEVEADLALVAAEVDGRLTRMADDLRRHTADSEASIRRNFERISEATRLYGSVEASALNTDAITTLVVNARRIRPNPPLVFDLAQAEIERLSEMLKTLADAGDLTYDGEDRDWLLGLTKHASTSLDAISTTLDVGGQDYFDGSLWQSDLGQRYLEAQREAIARNVRVRRLFVLDRPDLWNDEKFHQVLGMHTDLSIEVRALDPTRSASGFIPPIFDFIIFDDVITYQSSPSTQVNEVNRINIASTQLVTNQAKVRRNIARFRELWRVATPIAPRDGAPPPAK